MKILLTVLFSLILISSLVSAETFKHKSDGKKTITTKESVKQKGSECSDTNPVCKNGYLSYIKRNKWDTPFNPHEVLNKWVVLASTVMPPGVPFVTMGNPKIDWDKVPKSLDPGLAMMPKGEKFAAVYFTFAILPHGGVLINELIVIGYRDNHYGRLITHTLDKEINGYKVTPKKELDKIMKEMRNQPGVITCNSKNY